MQSLDAELVREFLEIPAPADDVSVEVGDAVQLEGFRRLRLTIGCADGDQMPALLLLPDGVRDAPGVVVFHQHASQCDQHERELSYRLLQGRTLAAKVIADAQTALSALRARPEVAKDRIGVLGHSFGGNTAIFHAALDERVAFAATSGAAGTYRSKLANEVGIDRAEVIPGVLDVFDIDDLTRLICPRPLGIFAGHEDRHALDVEAIAETTADAYRDANAPDRLHVEITPGGHALTAERSRSLVDWVIRTALSI
jgi:dienelactone hydrolase